MTGGSSGRGVSFARRVFTGAGVYGLVVLLPQYFAEGRVGRDFPPPITHPEYYYGFIGVALAWQFAFFVISTDPARFRPLMIPAILEKAVFAVPVAVLYASGRVNTQMFLAGAVDAVLGVLFAIAYVKTRDK
jgi:hypothetical protein